MLNDAHAWTLLRLRQFDESAALCSADGAQVLDFDLGGVYERLGYLADRLRALDVERGILVAQALQSRYQGFAYIGHAAHRLLRLILRMSAPRSCIALTMSGG